MLLEITVYFWPDNFDPEEAENLGKKPKLEKNIMVINSEHVVAFNPHDNGKSTMVRLTNGEVFESTMPFAEFWDRMDEAEAERTGVFIPGDN
jgi:hypothetical protein